MPPRTGRSSNSAQLEFLSLLPTPQKESVLAPTETDLTAFTCTSEGVAHTAERVLGQEAKIRVQIVVLFPGFVTTGKAVYPSFNFFLN